MKHSKSTETEEIKDSKHNVSIHACERYVERIMEQEVESGKLSYDIIGKITILIEKIMNKEYPGYKELKSGNFRSTKYDAIFIIKNGVVVTVKNLDSDSGLTYKDVEGYEPKDIKKTHHAYSRGRKIYKKGY